MCKVDRNYKIVNKHSINNKFNKQNEKVFDFTANHHDGSIGEYEFCIL